MVNDMAMAFLALLEKYRKYSFSERDKGDRFERLMKAYLMTLPLYANQLKKIWLWNEFPYREILGGKDTGIDLVAQTVDGDYWAIQCKCFQEKSYITKPDVDSFLATSSKFFMDENLQRTSFKCRLWISTTNHWNSEAERIIEHQNPPVMRIGLTDLENSPIDWEKLDAGVSGLQARTPKKKLREHQIKAMNAFNEHFKNADRGRLIMACGTGKTFTSLKIAEKETGGKGFVLFLVPSIALLRQTLFDWTAEADYPINAICICSDAEVSRQDNDDGGYSLEDLALPASTSVPNVVRQFEHIRQHRAEGMTVVFSTYQSIEVISQAQRELKPLSRPCIFDLIICDEAHRTTGVSLKTSKGDYDESAFVKVHDNEFLEAKKRLYMTATPRLYTDDTKEKAKESEAYLCSMDDEAIYGAEVYRIGFGEAVDKGLLADYKVLVLTIQGDQIPASLKAAINDEEQDINADDASKLIGCINALSKRTLVEAELLKSADPAPMRRAVAFCQNIRISKHTTDMFNTHKEEYYESLSPTERAEVVSVEAQHVDGTMNATEREEKLAWLKSVNPDGMECRILTNVRCLSEGVDVPSLDAVLFLSARNSQVDVVQSVGRVMRTAPDKKYGYIIIPVIIPDYKEAEATLDKNDHFKVVWTVLNALRAHDDRFNATINKIELNKTKPCNIVVDTIGRGDGSGDLDGSSGEQLKSVQQELLLVFSECQNTIFGRMVKKVGNKHYWSLWAQDVAEIAERHIARIKDLIAVEGEHRDAFENFIAGLRRNINPAVNRDDAIEMLAQHIITKPVFEALFENYSFVQSNPVSVAMQRVIDLLDDRTDDREKEVFKALFNSVRESVEGIDNAEGKQKVIVKLYDEFFKSAFPKVVEKLGIVYTPVDVVDFIINSVSDVLKKEFDRSLSDENIHILDPFTGTGTFITRLIQSGYISQNALPHKYEKELHANEIVLLAYYIASINIENAYHDAMSGGDESYEAFEGICLTDTFQLNEAYGEISNFAETLPENSKRILAQKKAPLRILIGNPPYSVGQKSANDNAQNQSYPELEQRIADTYAKGSKSTNKNSLYDSYIKAFRWASDRLDSENGGIIAFVTNGAWIDGNATSGFRKCIEEEFSTIYVFNLRGNCRTQGELRKREAGNVFGLGSRTPISITLLVKKPKASQTRAQIFYRDIGDYLSAKEKLAQIKSLGSILNPKMELSSISPNKDFDWINQRDDLFETFIPIGDKDDKSAKTAFVPFYSCGVKTQRDSWCYNFSKHDLSANMQKTIDFYNAHLGKKIEFSSTDINWTRATLNNHSKGRESIFSEDNICTAMYRPFCKQHLYFDRTWNEMVYQIPKLFPTPQSKNLVICVPGVGVTKEFSALIVDIIPDLELIGKSQCFPLFYYEKIERDQLSLFDQAEGEYIRRDAISGFMLERCRAEYGPKTTSEDIFYYIYGLFHQRDYRKSFSADLKKMLPRIPIVPAKDFRSFVKAGKLLTELHLNYEHGEMPDQVMIAGIEYNNFHVEKMRFPSKDDKRCIVFNKNIRIENIPLEAYEYVINGKSAIEWLMERYQWTTNPDSKLANDPNQWSPNPRYILDLLLRVIKMSQETLKIMNRLPTIDFST